MTTLANKIVPRGKVLKYFIKLISFNCWLALNNALVSRTIWALKLSVTLKNGIAITCPLNGSFKPVFEYLML